jgi:hypothetical protein
MANAADARKRMEVTVETDQVLIIRRRRSTRGWCEECGREMEIVSLEDAAAIAGISGPLLHDEVAQRWHFSDSQERWVCLESLLAPGGSARRTGSEEER